VNDATITPTDNGPYLVEGSITLLDAEGNRYEVSDTVALSAAVATRTQSRFATARTRRRTSRP
jgi:hypothetical protein